MRIILDDIFCISGSSAYSRISCPPESEPLNMPAEPVSGECVLLLICNPAETNGFSPTLSGIPYRRIGCREPDSHVQKQLFPFDSSINSFLFSRALVWAFLSQRTDTVFLSRDVGFSG